MNTLLNCGVGSRLLPKLAGSFDEGVVHALGTVEAARSVETRFVSCLGLPMYFPVSFACCHFICVGGRTCRKCRRCPVLSLPCACVKGLLLWAVQDRYKYWFTSVPIGRPQRLMFPHGEAARAVVTRLKARYFHSIWDYCSRTKSEWIACFVNVILVPFAKDEHLDLRNSAILCTKSHGTVPDHFPSLEVTRYFG